MCNVQHLVTNHTESQISQNEEQHCLLPSLVDDVFIQKMHYSLTSCQLYFLVPLSSFLAHLLALSLYDLVPKGAHARGYALQLKIKHCSKLFLFKMLCCVLA